ncbi:nitrous oxide reductase family maturation protein NosD [Bacillus sp. REN10]|uniref:right-handed parallel beta-helix repeat-containing protein n=1 Tax=Bacillus sp. REN10 TaxID=2782541 RepID=UPI00193BD570|nr:nitrous oxide reductase family maturation protein NosD [Bacillus sp. REN10]
MKNAVALASWLILFPFSFSVVKADAPIELQPLIDQAPPKSEIRLERGLYAGPVVIDKPLTIKGEKGAVIDGGKNGNVVTIQADDVAVHGVTIQHSGKGAQQAGILIDKAKSAKIIDNYLKNVHYGVFIRGGRSHMISNNHFSSYPGHFSTRGNGIHLLATANNRIVANEMTNVQDGIYLDESSNNEMNENTISGSRYATHFMFSTDNSVKGNHFFDNINGVMAMNSKGIDIEENLFEKQLNYRGFGVLIYETEDVQLEDNDLLYNHNGLSLQSSNNISVKNNIIAGNYIGLITEGKNSDIQLSENRFEGNIIQTKLTGSAFSLDDGKNGNYWDDYHSYDVDGDQIGEVAYQGGSTYSRLLHQYPHLQFYFESPAMTVWQSAEKMFSLQSDQENADRFPLVQQTKPFGGSYGFVLLILLGAALYIWRRKRSESL